MDRGRGSMWVFPPVRRNSKVKRQWGHIYRDQFFWVCVFLQANYLVSFPTPDLPWDPHLSAHSPLNQDGSQSEGFWEEQDSLWPGIVSWVLTHKKPFCECVVCFPCPKRVGGGGRDPLILYSYRLLPPLCPCHDYYLKVFIRDKHWLFTLCCYFHFRGQTGGWL